MMQTVIPLAVNTVYRPQGYVHKLIESLFCSDYINEYRGTLHLYVGCKDSLWISQYAESRSICIHEMVEDAYAGSETEHRNIRFNKKYIQCLRELGDQDSGILVAEDDTIFRSNWYHCLIDTLSEMTDKGFHDFILSCYYADGVALNRLGRTFWSYNPHSFFGTQLVYYQRMPGQEFANYLHASLHTHRPADLRLSEFCTIHKNLFATSRSLVQHVGDVSIDAHPAHRAYNFNKSWPEADIQK